MKRNQIKNDTPNIRKFVNIFIWHQNVCMLIRDPIRADPEYLKDTNVAKIQKSEFPNKPMYVD